MFNVKTTHTTDETELTRINTARAPDDTPFHWPRLSGDAYWPGAQPGGVSGGDGRNRTANRQGVGSLHPRRASIRKPRKIRRTISRKIPGAGRFY